MNEEKGMVIASSILATLLMIASLTLYNMEAPNRCPEMRDTSDITNNLKCAGIELNIALSIALMILSSLLLFLAIFILVEKSGDGK